MGQSKRTSGKQPSNLRSCLVVETGYAKLVHEESEAAVTAEGGRVIGNRCSLSCQRVFT